VHGRKLVASAQWREAGGYVQHGSILIDDDQHLLQRGMEEGVALPDVPAPSTLRGLLPHVPSLDDLAGALTAAITAATGTVPARIAPDALLDDTQVRVRAEHYRDPAWIWRR